MTPTSPFRPDNHEIARELAEPAFAPRSVLSGKDASTLARTLLPMSQPEFSAAFKGSPMKRAKLPAMRRNAAVVLGDVATAGDVDVLTRARRRGAARARARGVGAPPHDR